EDGYDILRSLNFERGDFETERAGRGLSLAHFQHGGGIIDIGQNRQTAQPGDNLAQELEPFAGKIGALHRQAGHVAARPRQTCDQASAERVVGRPEHDWDNRCRLLCREHCASHRDNNIDFEPDELSCDLSEAFWASLRPANLDPDSAAIDPTEFAQPLYERGDVLALDRSRARAQEADSRQLSGLLRPRRERPRGSRADRRDELAPFHHSITSSARASSVGGILRPSALAVVRLIVRANPVQNLIDIATSAPEQVGKAWSIGHETSRFDVLPIKEYGRQACG